MNMNLRGSAALFWNIWGHRVPLGINVTLLQEMLVTDVMCLTEVTHMQMPYIPVPAVHTSENKEEPPTYLNGLEQLTTTLGREYAIRYFSPHYTQWECKITKDTFDQIGFGSALLYRRELNVLGQGEELINVGDKKHNRVFQWIAYEKGGYIYLVAHLHGVWFEGNTKGDDPRRNEQSLQVLQYIANLKREFGIEKVVFGGDLNLDRQTDALRILEMNEGHGDPLVNLITKHGHVNTRTERYRRWVDRHKGVSMYADWVFTTKEVAVHDFTVNTANQASDHAPVFVHFS